MIQAARNSGTFKTSVNVQAMELPIRFCLSVLLAVFLLACAQSYGQSLGHSDFSQVRVDDLTDEQLVLYVRQAEAMGMTADELVAAARQRGMPQAEVEKLQTRVAMLTGTQAPSGTAIRREREERQLSDTIPVPLKTARDSVHTDSLEVFGRELFRSVPVLFEPNLRLATPRNYVLGPGDQVLIDIYGRSEDSYTLNVSPEGAINIPYVGVVSVGGLTIEQASERITRSLSAIYSAIRTGGTKVNITLGNIRSIKVVVTGEAVRPATYTLPSVATIFNALYYAGGPSDRGSFRDIRLIRNGQEIARLDVYDFLTTGAFRENVRLEDQDVIMISPYVNRVILRGEVKRPAIYELKENETFQDLLGFAGGFTEHAYQARIKVIKPTARERRIEDLLSSQIAQYQPAGGDEFVVERILDRFENRVRIEGAVFREGPYELSPGLTVSMLIKKAEGLKEDAFLNRGTILRLNDNLQYEQLSFNVAGILAGTEQDIELKREDVVRIYSAFELREAFSVSIDGEVRFPGTFRYAEGMALKDLIMQAGGFRESASPSRIEISRRVLSSDIMSQSATIAEIFQVDADKQLSKEAGDFILRPFDKVTVRTATGYETQKTVRIYGEVLYPGSYTINRKDERISDIIKRAGGLTPFAYVDGASLRREGVRDERDSAAESGVEAAARERRKEEELNRLAALQQLQSDAAAFHQLDIDQRINTNLVGINLEQILKKPRGRGDLILQDGDIIYIPRELQTVKVSGEVLAPSTAIYSPTKGFKQYISQAGGFSSRALRRSVYVLYANGTVKSTSRFLIFNNYPPIKPGAEIFVPQRELRPPIGVQQWLGFGTGIASLAAIIVTIFR